VRLATQAPSPATSLRLVEVQAMDSLSPVRPDWQSLASDLFPDPTVVGPLPTPTTPPAHADPMMARARIVRVSPPIEIVSA
jgi:hypothetical protein